MPIHLTICLHRYKSTEKQGDPKAPNRPSTEPTTSKCATPEEIANLQRGNENSPRSWEMKLRKNEMKLRKNEIKVLKNIPFPPWTIQDLHRGIPKFLGRAVGLLTIHESATPLFLRSEAESSTFAYSNMKDGT